MKNETARREIESLDYYLQNHTDDYSEESHTAMMMAIQALEQELKTDYISIDDVMSVFDDFMCGEVDEDGMDTFLEMLKDKAESEE